ncbi:MAG TPA: TIGR00266 family protein [Myxococcales bacterium]|nr:TIGR00266 family protein [Myxococcales bacterium]
MNHEIALGPSFAVLKVGLQRGDVLTAEAGSMVSRFPRVKMRTRLNAPPGAGFFGLLGAFLTALVRRAVAGESFMVNDFTCDEGGEVTLAPTFSGTITARKLHHQSILLTRGAFLACTGDLKLTMRWGGLRGLLAREGLFFMEVSGTGELFYTSYGGALEVPVNGTLTVDHGHVVAFDTGLDYRIRLPGGGLMGLFASGVGLVVEFSGRGTVVLQSRNVSTLTGWLLPRLP